jgi:hypothetical protein
MVVTVRGVKQVNEQWRSVSLHLDKTLAAARSVWLMESRGWFWERSSMLLGCEFEWMKEN